ncbi:hypothetical protein TNCV_467081 [Trichonephila clavipes]|nr:hypothetical protein TNCV_467081 [Trichonephila clavipes]
MGSENEKIVSPDDPDQDNGAKLLNYFIVLDTGQELWFQQDGATCHTARATIDLLKDTLGARLISRFGPVNLPLVI